MDFRVDGEERIDNFIRDVISTFKLHSPTIIFDGDEEAPEICYSNQWVLCLPSKQPKTTLEMGKASTNPTTTSPEGTGEGKAGGSEGAGGGTLLNNQLFLPKVLWSVELIHTNYQT